MQEKIPSFKGTFVQCGPGFPVLLSKKKKNDHTKYLITLEKFKCLIFSNNNNYC